MLDARIVARMAGAVGLKTWPSFIAACCCTAKVILILGGWRGGKSARVAFILFCRIYLKWLLTPLPVDAQGAPLGTHLVWLVGPDYEDARPEYFYISQWSKRLGLVVEASAAMQGSLRMTIAWPGKPGIVEVVTKSAKDPTSLGSVPPVEIAMCEAGLITEEADLWIDGRTAEKNAGVIKGGTFENDEGKAQMAWFEEQAKEALANPTAHMQAFTCPTWENEALYSNCLEGANSIINDPTLADWCPDSEHGEGHSGLRHPMICKLKERWKDRPRDWAKRFGGEPQGIRDPMYEWATVRPTFYLRPMPEELKSANFGRSPIWQLTGGGIDPGLVHPAALTVGSIVANGPCKGQTWVRRCIQDTSGSADKMWQAKDFLQKRYGVTTWGGDPVGLQYTRSFENIEAMRGSFYSRMARVKIVNGIAQDEMLFFDSDDPGVVLLFQQIQRVHFRRDANGQLVYDRLKDDDMAASFENMMAVLHGQANVRLPERARMRVRPAARPTYQRVRI